MAFRGRGRGRGRGGFGGGFGGAIGNPEPYILFPEDVQLPDINGVPEEKALVLWNYKLQSFWRSSPYYLEKPTEKKNQENDIERYSDRNKPNDRAKRAPLSYHLKLTPKNFPRELLEGRKQVQHDQSKGFSYHNQNKGTGLFNFDDLEKREQKYQDQETKGGKEKKDKENEDEDEDEEEIDEEDSEMSEDDDYAQNEVFDDDEDDYNEVENDNPDDDNIY